MKPTLTLLAEPRWRSQQQLRRAQVSDPLRDWLLEPGSLTRRLRSCCAGQFQVRVLDQGLQRPQRGEAKALHRPAHELTLVRQVLLCCGEQPWVYARTVIPLPSLQGGLQALTRLGNRPLGELLFADPSMQRSPIEVAPLRGLLPAPLSRQDSAGSWGRRSVFTLWGRPLLVSEFFLPALWQTHP